MCLIKSRNRELPGLPGNEKGQTLVEYALLLLLLAVVLVAMIKVFGETTKNTYNKIADSVSNAAK